MSTFQHGVVMFRPMSNWTFGTFLCKLQPFIMQASGDSSTWVIAIVSIDRYTTQLDFSKMIKEMATKKFCLWKTDSISTVVICNLPTEIHP
jgi:hypothetical protein